MAKFSELISKINITQANSTSASILRYAPKKIKIKYKIKEKDNENRKESN